MLISVSSTKQQFELESANQWFVAGNRLWFNHRATYLLILDYLFGFRGSMVAWGALSMYGGRKCGNKLNDTRS